MSVNRCPPQLSFGDEEMDGRCPATTFPVRLDGKVATSV